MYVCIQGIVVNICIYVYIYIYIYMQLCKRVTHRAYGPRDVSGEESLFSVINFLSKF